ncbi:ABC transporter ATP-binding protein [Cronobacter muytjensii]|uniref:ABC transporter ATP-binding protein n=1 Tax=Cronobacter muytjensii TaxID=413501 RepID=A0A2T7AWR3_9ENTR|nr:ABC transporter ATP-binding protein [Cronobacter muytjensii]KAB0884732.1 ABC transporter ATP-binding protein [Cronobacter muytjensii]MBF4813467.1 ABC transporter ATP-binding protein [Cronobacter muytjensii]PUX16656.1 ABC transporter ATP-binding protein [Cronobacter muytjensii]
MNAVPDVLHITGLTLRSREQGLILNDLNVSVGKGEKLAVVGPNGSGKSTLLRLLISDATPDAGLILLEGRPLEAFSPTARARKIAYLAQHDAPDPRLTLEEYVALGRTPFADSKNARRIVDEIIEETGLAALRQRLLGTLSGGQRQRAALARALAQSPALLLLDEPTNHLDPPARAALLSLVKSKGIAVIAVLHDLAAIDDFADRVLVLHQGRQVACATPDIALQTSTIFPVFGMQSFSVRHPLDGRSLRIFDVPRCA